MDRLVSRFKLVKLFFLSTYVAMIVLGGIPGGEKFIQFIAAESTIHINVEFILWYTCYFARQYSNCCLP